MSSCDPQYDFRSKYLTRNPVAQWLINAFYQSAHSMLRGIDPSSVLEVGCGEGFSTARLRQMLPSSTMFEASEVERRLLPAARARNPNVEISLESIYALERDAASFDLVVCLEVLEHLERPSEALAELARVANKWLLLSVPREPLWRVMNMARLRHWSQLGNTPGHVQHWSKAGFLAFVSTRVTPIEVHTPIPWTQILGKIRR